MKNEIKIKHEDNLSKYNTEWLVKELSSQTHETRDDVSVTLKFLFPCAKIYVGGHHVAVIDPVDQIRTVMVTGTGNDWN